MSAAKLMFGKRKSEKKKNQEVEAASRKLTEVLHVLEKKSEHYENKIDEQLRMAKKHSTKNKRLAIGALKRKRRYEEEHARLQATITTLEFQLDAISSAKLSSEVIAAMGKAKNSLDHAHKGLDLDRINNLHDSVEEQLQLSNELGQALSDPVMDGQFDEDELLEELQALELESSLTNIPRPQGGLSQAPSRPLQWPPAPAPQQPSTAHHRVMLNHPQPVQQPVVVGRFSDAAAAVDFGTEGSTDEDDDSAASGASGVRIGGPGGGRPADQRPFWMQDSFYAPDVPTEEPHMTRKSKSKKKVLEEDDMNALQAWAS